MWSRLRTNIIYRSKKRPEMLWAYLVFVLLPLVNVIAAEDNIITNGKWDSSHKPEDIKVINISQDRSLPLDLSTLSATASPGSTVYVVLLNGNSQKQDVKTDKDSDTQIIFITTTPQPPTGPIEISPSHIELPARQEPTPIQKVVSPARREPVTLITSTPAPSWIPTKKPQPVQTAPPPPPPITEPALIWRKEPAVESRPPPAPVETSTSRVTKIVLPSKEPAKPKPVVNEPIILPSKRRPITLPNNRPKPEEPKMIVAPKQEPTTNALAIVVEPKPTPAPAKPVVVYHPPASSPAPPAYKIVPTTPTPAVPKPTYIEQRPKPTPAPITPTKPPSINSLPPSPTTLVPTQLFDYNCKDANGYYRVVNECDTYVECKKHAASKVTCPEGLHFNPKAVWPEYPCGYPSEVQCEINALKQLPIPSSECPHQYGYYALADDCGKYVMCQEGRAIVMNCPTGLAFNDATSSCDWPENVPTCKLGAFGGFTCPAPPRDESGDLMDVIYKYRYGQSCREYVACQHGAPRLLSCDLGYSFDEDSQVCVDSDYVQNCRS